MLDNLSSSNAIAYLKKQFAWYGYIDELVTDNNPQFSSFELKKFAKEHQFTHTHLVYIIVKVLDRLKDMCRP